MKTFPNGQIGFGRTFTSNGRWQSHSVRIIELKIRLEDTSSIDITKNMPRFRYKKRSGAINVSELGHCKSSIQEEGGFKDTLPTESEEIEKGASLVTENQMEFSVAAGADSVSVATRAMLHDAETEFALMGLKLIKRILQDPHLDESMQDFDKWKESSKNLVKQINISNSPEKLVTSLRLRDNWLASCPSMSTPSSTMTTASIQNSQTTLSNQQLATIIRLLSSVPAGSRNRPTSVPAGRPFSAGWKNHAARPMTRPTSHYFQHFSRPGYYNQMYMDEGRWGTAENPHKNRDLGIVDSGCSRSMTGNKEKLDDFVKIVGGTVTFGGGDGKITGKGTIRTSKLNFENVYYVEELHNFNLFSVSQICDSKNKVLFIDKECLVLSKEVQLPENSQVVLRVPRRNNLYCFNLSDIKPERDVTCLLAKASLVESTKWHRRMAHVNFKNMNKLAKHGLVNGLPSKLFTNEHNCVACNKGKQHKASYKAITAVSTISAPLQLLHMDLFCPTSIRSIDHKYYSLVVTDDFSRFTWVFFFETKDETYGILKDFITFIENQLTKKVKAIRKNRTVIEAARTMLADFKLPTMFWTEAVSTACYILNRVLVTQPHNKTPYELVSGKVPNISHLKPFGCLVAILNTSDHLGKFEGKADEGFIVGYDAHSKAYRVYNLSSKKIEETLNLRYLEDKPHVQGLGHEWYFDLDYLTDSFGYTRFKTNQPACTQDTNIHAGTQADSDSECDEQVIVVPSFPSNSFLGPKVNEASKMMESISDYVEELARLQKQAYEANTTAEKHMSQADLATSRNVVPTGKIVSAADVSDGHSDTSTPVCTPVHTVATSLPPGHSLGSSVHSSRYTSPSDLANSMSSSSEMEDIHHHSDTGIFSSSSYDDDFGGTVTNLAPSVVVDSVLTKRVNTIHPQSQILGDLTSPVQTRGTLKKSKFGASAFVSYVHDQQRNNHTDYLHCLFACFLSQLEPSSVTQALNDPAWVEAMQEEMQQFINQKVWQLVPLPDGKIAIGTKWILKNKRDARVARIEAIRLFLAFASYMGFMVYQMDVKSAFLYGEIEEEVYVTQPKGFEDPHFPKHVYRVVKALRSSSSTKGPDSKCTTFLLKHNYRRGTIDKTLFIKKNSRDIILVQRLNFQGDHMPLLATMLPLLKLLLQGERPTTTTSSAPVNGQGPSSDPNIASSSRPHESAPNLFTSTNMEDETMGGSFHTSPPRSTQAPPEGTTSGGAKDLDKLTALSSLVSTLVQKVNTQESEFKAHKLLFKEVVGKLVKKVKLLEDKLKGRKRKFVMTDSDKEEDAEQDVDPLIKLAKAAATAAAALAVPTSGSHEADIPPSSSILSDEFAGGSDIPAGATIGTSADPSNKGKSPLLEEDPPVRERTFRQREEDRLGEEAARRMYEEE
ncbi:putative ribonuclease H-like domain-containing protein [Tanacetum coccineum]